MAIDNNVKLSNVIGAPFSDYVLLQLYQRAAHNSTLNRSNEDVLFLANKTAWARLVSSVNISNDLLGLVYRDLGVNYSTPEGLAQNWILEAGTSKQKGNGIELRYGIGPDGAYGLGGTDELGYRPMPGLTSVQVETTGRLGSLRQATIQFKAWNMDQLNVIEALYFRLGYSMLLEWGHTQYFNNKGVFQSKEIYGIDDPFKPKKRKEQIQQAIALKARNSFGNYDGMLGIVSNFTWAMNQDGGYDCTVKLVGLGAVMDSMRINQAYKLPQGSLKQYRKNKGELARLQAEIIALQNKIKNLPSGGGGTAAASIKEGPPKTPSELRFYFENYYYTTKQTDEVFKNEFGITAFAFNRVKNTIQKVEDYYANFTKASATINAEANVKAGGLWLTDGAAAFINVKNGDVVTLDTQTLIETTGTKVPTLTGADTNTSLLSVSDVSIGFQPAQLFQYYLSRVERPSYWNGQVMVGGGTDTFTSSDKVPQGKLAGSFQRTLGQTSKSIVTGNDITWYYKLAWNVDRAGDNAKYTPTILQLAKSLDSWITPTTGTHQMTLRANGITKKGIDSIEIVGDFSTTIKDVTYSGDPAQASLFPKTADVKVYWSFFTNNAGYLQAKVTTPVVTTPKSNTAQNGNTGDTGGTVNKASTEQQDVAAGFASALQAMLITVQAQAQVKRAESNANVLVVDIKELTSKFYQEGTMNGILDTKGVPNKIPAPSTSEFNLVQYAAKGFNSQLMIDPTLYNDILPVEFDKMCKALIVAYNQGGTDAESTKLRAPVYISFGYLLAFLNNMCLIYDSPESKIPTNNNPAQGTPKRPYVYIDFNPETNFCLTSPQQLSVDPTTCLIAFQSNLASYKAIFPEDIVKNWSTKKDSSPLFDPGSGLNVVSGKLTKEGFSFKGDNAYQGKIMNIMLNIDYLLGLVASLTGSDPEHAVRLEPFLQKILADVNKSLGNTNSFRVAYRDDSNTIQIQDDQWVPSLIKETNMLQASVYNSKLIAIDTGKLSGLIPVSSDPKELPVAGQLSLARQFQLRSVMSTKLASMIAISAQAATGSVNATDHSSLSYLNFNFQDRYKPYIQDASNGNAGSNVNTKNNEPSNDEKAAQMFNTHINTIYSSLLLNPESIDLAKNYYIERMSKVKSGDPVVSSAPFIPAELEMTLDGISGIIMGNAFTVPQDRLPLSLRGKNGLAKIAFIVTGLTHTIQNNEWLTKIKGQMIKLREKVEIAKASNIIGELIEYNTPPPLSSGGNNLKGKALYNDKAFRAKLKTITDKYGISDEDLLTVMNAETGLNPQKALFLTIDKSERLKKKGLNGPAPGYKLFAVGLIQFTPNNEKEFGVTLEQIYAMSALEQLDLVDKYFSYFKRGLKGGNIYVVYGYVFYPEAVSRIKSGDDSWLIGSQIGPGEVLAVSRDNPKIAAAAGARRGIDGITVGGFKRYVDSIR
jgi:hypothetical protein